jgi:hypothetical protein
MLNIDSDADVHHGLYSRNGGQIVSGGSQTEQLALQTQRQNGISS